MKEAQEKYKELIEEESISLEKEPQLEEKAPPAIEEEVLELERQLVAKKAELTKEKKAEREPTKEKPRLEERLEEGVAPALTRPSAQVQQPADDLKGLDKETQIKTLCDLAFQKGLDFAIEAAKGLDNAYVLDEFHNALVNQLHDKLVEKGELKQP